MLEVPSYEFHDFALIALPTFITRVNPQDLLFTDHQLVKQISFKFLLRLTGRHPELEAWGLHLREQHIEHVTREDMQEIRKLRAPWAAVVVPSPQKKNEVEVVENLEGMKIEEEEEKVDARGRLEENMRSYYQEVQEEN